MALTTKTLTRLIRTVYAVGMLSEADEKTYWLIDRYSDKVSQRLLDKQQELLKLGEECLTDYMTQLMQNPNPFMALIDKSDPFSGKYIPVPLKGSSK